MGRGRERGRGRARCRCRRWRRLSAGRAHRSPPPAGVPRRRAIRRRRARRRTSAPWWNPALEYGSSSNRGRTNERAMTARRVTTAARRQVILDAALGLFTTRGLRATSVEDIRSASGASNGSLYHHFGSKEGIAAALYAAAIEDYQRGAA